MPPLNGNMNQCNTENCKRCRNKYTCATYLNYLEDIVNSPVSVSTPILSEQTDVRVDLTPILTSLSDTSKKITNLDDKNSGLFLDLSDTQAKVMEQGKEISTKLDIIINIFKKYGSPSVSAEIQADLNEEIDNELSQNGLVVYDAGASVLKKGDTYFEEKKTLFGGTKMVEKVIK